MVQRYRIPGLRQSEDQTRLEAEITMASLLGSSSKGSSNNPPMGMTPFGPRAYTPVTKEEPLGPATYVGSQSCHSSIHIYLPNPYLPIHLDAHDDGGGGPLASLVPPLALFQ